MKRKLILGCLATVFTMGYPGKAKSQDDSPDQKVRIEITTKENGSTQHVTREFDLSNGEALEDALRELGVFDEIGVINDGENLVIDLKRVNEEGGTLKDMCMALSMEDLADLGGAGGYLGVYGGDWNSSTCADDQKKNKNNKAVKEGACITQVIDDTPAAQAGLVEGDVITMIDGDAVGSFGDLAEKIGGHAPGDEVELTYWRDGKKDTMKVTLAEHSSDDMTFNFEMPEVEGFQWNGANAGSWGHSEQAFLGVNGEDAGDGGGARVTGVVEGTNAETMGIQEGDVIKALNGVNVNGFSELAEMIGEMEPGAGVKVDVQRDGKTTTLEGVLGAQETMGWIEAPELPDAAMAPMPPMPPMPNLNGGEMSPEDRAEFQRAMAEYQRDMAEHARDMQERGRDQNEFRRDMEELRAQMDQLRRELRGGVTREMTVVIGTVELSKEETDVLKNKGVTGLEADMDLPALKCFPNPSEGNFHLLFDVPERGDLNVDIHDANGERVYHETITGFKGHYDRTLDLSDRADGTYFLVIGQNGKALARKLVKQ